MKFLLPAKVSVHPTVPGSHSWQTGLETLKKGRSHSAEISAGALKKLRKRRQMIRLDVPVVPSMEASPMPWEGEGEEDHQAHGGDTQRSLPSETTDLFLAPPDLSYPHFLLQRSEGPHTNMLPAPPTPHPL